MIRSLVGPAVAAVAVRREERRLVGLLGGVLFLVGGFSLLLFMVFPGVTHAHRVALLVLGAIACASGACLILLIDWERAPDWWLLPPSVLGLVLCGLAIASSGGSQSPAWGYLFLVVALAAYFFPRPGAYAMSLGCAITYGSVLFYDPRALHGPFRAQLLLAMASYVLLGSAILAGRQRMWELRDRAERLAAEQSALRRVALAVAGAERAEQIYERVSLEMAQLLGAGGAGILRREDERTAVVTGSWADHPGGRYEPGRTVEIVPGGDIDQALRSGRAVRIERHGPGSPVLALGYRSSIVAPVPSAHESWGVLAVSAERPFSAADEQHLLEFADLLATAIASLEDRAKLAAQASSDPLTGLANHRSLQHRLAVELARAARHASPLSVALLDVDQFKVINDIAGHDAGDQMLLGVASCLAKLARAEDTLGRVGGDEFAWVLPESTREQALVAVERARRMVAAELRRPYRVTVSAGICDTTVTHDPAQLIRLADRALYWSKAHGRNQCWVYDPAVVSELSAHERGERLERSQALLGLGALARAIDAKDPAVGRHSERVSELVRRLALSVGWTAERARLLSEAALVHDVGKLGVPESVLLKPGPLTAAERAQVELHAELTARIVEDVLAPEQVVWIRTQHERPDGRGYPAGLRGAEISEGAALLAAADAWDAMTISPPYGSPKDCDEALGECIELTGRQFTKTAVEALVQLDSAAELVPPALASLAVR